MSHLRRGAAVLAAALTVTAATATPAQAATSTPGTAWVKGATVHYFAKGGTRNVVTLTRSGRTVTIDDRVTVRPGKGCKAVSGDRTKVRCRTASKPQLISVGLGTGNDRLVNRTAISASAIGGPGDDVLVGGPGADGLSGDGGRDTMDGGDGANTLSGGADADILYGGPGDETLTAGRGDDVVYGGSGDDLIWGGGETDRLYGGAGDDTLLVQDPQSTATAAEYVNGGPNVTTTPGDTCYVPGATHTGCETFR